MKTCLETGWKSDHFRCNKIMDYVTSMSFLAKRSEVTLYDIFT